MIFVGLLYLQALEDAMVAERLLRKLASEDESAADSDWVARLAKAFFMQVRG